MDYYKTTVILQVTFLNDLHKVHILLLISLSSMLNTLTSSFSNLREQHVTLEYKSILVITKHLAKLWPIIEKSIGLYWGSMDQLPISSPHLQTEQSTGPHNWWILLLNIFYILAGPETCTCWSAAVLWDCAKVPPTLLPEFFFLFFTLRYAFLSISLCWKINTTALKLNGPAANHESTFTDRTIPQAHTTDR